jgi:cell division septation protein DedD
VDAKGGTKPVPAAKAVEGEQSAGKALEVTPSPVAGPNGAEAKTTATARATAEGTAQQNATQAAPRIIMVQIASFSTEKNANAALVWLKDKGYSEARVARVEQGQTVYHRVQAGPFQDLATARKALEELKADWPQAFIPAD